jgi:ABC-type glycerol-3-phosphate transport system substrate-binding protein
VASGAKDATLAPFPNFADDASKPGSAFIANGWTLCVPKGAQTDEAWQFLDFFQSVPAQLINMKVGQQLPTRKSALEDPYFSTPAAATAVMVLDWMKANPHAGPVHVKNYPDLTLALGSAFQQIITNRADVGSALSKAAQQYANTLK